MKCHLWVLPPVHAGMVKGNMITLQPSSARLKCKCKYDRIFLHPLTVEIFHRETDLLRNRQKTANGLRHVNNKWLKHF